MEDGRRTSNPAEQNRMTKEMRMTDCWKTGQRDTTTTGLRGRAPGRARLLTRSVSGQPVLEVGSGREIQRGDAEAFELVERELSDAGFGCALQDPQALAQHAQDELALALPAFSPADLNALFLPTGCQFHNFGSFFSAQQRSRLGLEPQGSFGTQSQNQGGTK